MDFIIFACVATLLVSAIYVGLNGGRTGKAGSAILIIAAMLSNVAARTNPDWVGISFALLLIDSGCLLALMILALTSDRHWPIWAMGLQTAAVAAHLAILFIPDTTPKIYQALLSFWSLLILWVMVSGTFKDRQYERGQMQLG